MKRILLVIFVLTLAPLANVVASEGDVSPYYLANPSFEQARSDGGAAGWSGGVFRFCDCVGRRSHRQYVS